MQDPDDLLFAVTGFLHAASFLRWKPILSNYAWYEFPEAGQSMSNAVERGQCQSGRLCPMSSLLTHPAPVLALGVALGLRRIPPRLFILAVVFSLVPDFDSAGFRFGVSYASWLGHRGFSHSLFFALLCGIFAAWIAPWLKASRLLSGTLIFLTIATHIALDAMTNGGLGVAVFWPFSEARHFLPWQPIQVSPLSPKVFFTTEKGLRVIVSELRWVWLPLMLVALACRAFVRKNRTSR
jgi:inner membrane protein